MIKVEELSKSYRKKKVVDGLSFAMEEGELFALLGSNGAGGERGQAADGRGDRGAAAGAHGIRAAGRPKDKRPTGRLLFGLLVGRYPL